MQESLHNKYELEYTKYFLIPPRTKEPSPVELESLKEQFENVGLCACVKFPISGHETFFIAKERIAILIYNTDYVAAPIWIDDKL